MNRLIVSIFAMALTISSFAADHKVLVAYFSATGTTKAVAEQIALAAHGDVLSIDPVQPYTDADLNWRNDRSRSSVEMKDEAARPAIRKTRENLNEYDIVYIGFPVWWYVAPRIINTFLETYDLSGKTIVPFATSGGSGIAGCTNALRKTYPNLTFDNGRLLNYPSFEEVQDWTNKIAEKY